MCRDQELDSMPRDVLWSLTPCGGCAAKAAASVAMEFSSMAGIDGEKLFMNDAGVGEIDGHRIGFTVDFITPLVPDPLDYGRIAAANALSDVYAAGMLPRYALTVACVPYGQAERAFASALRAAISYLNELGCTVIGGHSVTDPEPKLGFAVIGVPNLTGRLLGTGARPGDALILTKPLGVGVITSACKLELLDNEALNIAIRTMLAPSSFLPALLEHPLGQDVHAATDVSGFGLLGHLKEMCIRSGVGAEVSLARIPVLPYAAKMANQGISTSAFDSNVQYISDCCPALAALPESLQIVLTDPQTSGGLLLSVSVEQAEHIRANLPPELASAAVIGRMTADKGRLALVS